MMEMVLACWNNKLPFWRKVETHQNIELPGGALAPNGMPHPAAYAGRQPRRRIQEHGFIKIISTYCLALITKWRLCDYI
jgi:hypothetical protein